MKMADISNINMMEVITSRHLCWWVEEIGSITQIEVCQEDAKFWSVGQRELKITFYPSNQLTKGPNFTMKNCTYIARSVNRFSTKKDSSIKRNLQRLIALQAFKCMGSWDHKQLRGSILCNLDVPRAAVLKPDNRGRRSVGSSSIGRGWLGASNFKQNSFIIFLDHVIHQLDQIDIRMPTRIIQNKTTSLRTKFSNYLHSRGRSYWDLK